MLHSLFSPAVLFVRSIERIVKNLVDIVLHNAQLTYSGGYKGGGGGGSVVSGPPPQT